ncbi:MAG: hypothetical protein D4R65_12335 [Verrucomicrobiaceae bacterium]|nr:MAG: hypothetical protein D4R65_12335 [Verrucomicrobiaceae bacterium]
MTDAGRAAIRQALATAGTAFAVGALHVPQPFLAVLAAQLTAGIAFAQPADFFKRIAAAWAGSLCGVLLLVALPEQYWFSLPLFGVAVAVGAAGFSKFGGAAILFAMGIGGMFSAGIVHPQMGLLAGSAHAASLSIAVAATWFARGVCPTSERDCGSLPSYWLTGLTGVLTLVTACVTIPTESVVMSIAAMVTSLALTSSGGIPQKLAGGVLGVAVSLVFLTVVSGAGNDFAVFLLAMAIVMGGFEWLAVSLPNNASLFRQGGALFAVAATILPRPEQFLFASWRRMLAVLLGLAVASLIHAAFDSQARGKSPAG